MQLIFVFFASRLINDLAPPAFLAEVILYIDIDRYICGRICTSATRLDEDCSK